MGSNLIKVSERGAVETAPVEAPRKAGFRPLIAVLRDICTVYTDHRVPVPVSARAPIPVKTEDLISRVAVLDELFATRPGGVEEQRRRLELIGCHDSFLRLDAEPFQQVQGHRRAVSVPVRDPSAAENHFSPCSRRRKGFWTPRRAAGDNFRLPGLPVTLTSLSMFTMTTDGKTNGELQRGTQVDSECSPFGFGQGEVTSLYRAQVRSSIFNCGRLMRTSDS